MYCPVCKEVALVMADRQGIEVDYCPQCRGVWLDRGELDKIIERSVPGTAAPRPTDPRRPGYDSRPQPTHREPEYKREHHGHKKKHHSFLGELFDFD